MSTILITGASDGLGRALAEDLAAGGRHQLLLHGRNADRLAQVAQATGGVPLRADLSSLAEVKRLAARVSQAYDRLDVLVNNAGVGFHVDGTARQLSRDGYELCLAVNYLAPVLLTRELLPLLRRAPAARVVNVASVGQQPIDFDDPQFEHDFREPVAYSRAKLALICHTMDLADELAGTGVTANSVHPASYMPTSMSTRSGMDFVDTLEKGVSAVRRLVDGAEVAGVTGHYFDSGQEARAAAEAYEPNYRQRLRALTRDLLAGF
ncbi:SDR family NAD(P)-dependent oxidoreductase [Micromonospora sp. NPDC005367]|uniref:SDR family NAD(P)-dependent oxidoreductase n=1 Tax=Micromonospora sp. NPDC005367 TaxID=3155590 RepID=UPI0033AC4430